MTSGRQLVMSNLWLGPHESVRFPIENSLLQFVFMDFI